VTTRTRIPVPALETGAAAGQAVPVPGAETSGRHLDDVLSRGRVRATLWMFGPAFVASVAYVDPGNFATNVAAGSQFGYMLLWVILVSNLMAMLIQTMSAKLGIATGMNLPEVCRAISRGSRRRSWSSGAPRKIAIETSRSAY